MPGVHAVELREIEARDPAEHRQLQVIDYALSNLCERNAREVRHGRLECHDAQQGRRHNDQHVRIALRRKQRVDHFFQIVGHPAREAGFDDHEEQDKSGEL